jgi:prepilin-type N-terminal cleavage/methylation domain-containing protein
MNSHYRAFTLIELLIVIGILAVLSVITMIVINPAELLARTRDTNRISDLSSLNSSLSMLLAFHSNLNFGNPNTVYVSLPSDNSNCSDLGLPSLPSGWSYHCVNKDNLRKVNGSGWIPVDLTQFEGGSPISSLPLDPKNTYIQDLTQSNDFFYTYAINSSGEWELNAKTESSY